MRRLTKVTALVLALALLTGCAAGRAFRRGEDRATVARVLAGDRDAFRVLVDRESAAVVRACHRVLGDLHEAEDAAQECARVVQVAPRRPLGNAEEPADLRVLEALHVMEDDHGPLSVA